MHRRLILSLLVVVILMTRNFPVSANECDKHPATLAAMQDCYRPLLIFAPSASDKTLQQQLAELRSHAAELRERDVIVVVIANGGSVDRSQGSMPMATLTGNEAAAARKQFAVDDKAFTVVLVGKDGGEKYRQSEVLTVASLNKRIDGMPMRQDEMRQK